MQLSAQMLHATDANHFNGQPEFFGAFIRTNGIKTIAGNYATKAPNDMMRSSSEFVYYKFNRFGELTFEYRTFLNDTLYTLYVWDERSNLILKRTANRFGFSSVHYRYDSSNRLTFIETRRCNNIGQDLYTFVPEESDQISYEKYEYTDLDDKTYKKSYLNGSGGVYKEEFFYLNESGKIIEQTGYQKSGGGKTSTIYEYDKKNRLITMTYESSVAGNHKKKCEYEYDEAGNVFAMKYYENEIYLTEYQYVYDSSNHLLKAIIARDIATEVMTIVKYDAYTYHGI